MQVLGLVTNIISRTYEFQADHFAVGLGHARPLAAALKVLDKKNRSATNVDAWCVQDRTSTRPLSLSLSLSLSRSLSLSLSLSLSGLCLAFVPASLADHMSGPSLESSSCILSTPASRDWATA